MLHQIYKAFFAWPSGAVWGNLLASAIWAIPAFLHLHAKLDRHHREMHTKHKKKG